MAETDYEKERRLRKDWLANLKVGDRVAVEERRGYSGPPEYALAVVKHITPKRNRFDLTFDRGWGLKSVNADGYETGGGGFYSRKHIEPITEKVLYRAKSVELNDRLEKLVQTKDGRGIRKDLTFDQIERIILVLEESHGQEPKKDP